MTPFPTVGARKSILKMRGRDEMGWIILMCLIVLVVAFAVSMGFGSDWTDFLP